MKLWSVLRELSVNPEIFSGGRKDEESRRERRNLFYDGESKSLSEGNEKGILCRDRIECRAHMRVWGAHG